MSKVIMQQNFTLFTNKNLIMTLSLGLNRDFETKP